MNRNLSLPVRNCVPKILRNLREFPAGPKEMDMKFGNFLTIAMSCLFLWKTAFANDGVAAFGLGGNRVQEIRGNRNALGKT